MQAWYPLSISHHFYRENVRRNFIQHLWTRSWTTKELTKLQWLNANLCISDQMFSFWHDGLWRGGRSTESYQSLRLHSGSTLNVHIYIEPIKYQHVILITVKSYNHSKEITQIWRWFSLYYKTSQPLDILVLLLPLCISTFNALDYGMFKSYSTVTL
jgi:hypothetical protein